MERLLLTTVRFTLSVPPVLVQSFDKLFFGKRPEIVEGHLSPLMQASSRKLSKHTHHVTSKVR